jgi:hypothetical protein
MRYVLSGVALFMGMSSFFPAGSNYAEPYQERSGSGAPQDRVQQLLSDGQDEEVAATLIFELGAGAVADLTKALQDGHHVERASQALAYLGGPEERKVVRKAIGSEEDGEKKSLMSSFLAGALVEPASREEWDFLQSCIKSYKEEDDGASINAALALGTNASQKALRLLQTARPLDEEQIPDNEIAKAVRWIKQKSSTRPTASTGAQSDSVQIRRTVLQNAFYAEGERKYLSLEKIVFTKEKTRALVSVEIYHGPKNARGYDLVLQKNNIGTWKIVGVWFSWIA